MAGEAEAANICLGHGIRSISRLVVHKSVLALHLPLPSRNLNFSSLLSLPHITERDLQETSRGMGCSAGAGRNAGPGQGSSTHAWIPAARMQFRSSPIGRASLGQAQVASMPFSEAPAAGCARTLTGESSRGLEVVGWRWDMNPSTMMKFRAAALPLGYDTSRRGL